MLKDKKIIEDEVEKTLLEFREGEKVPVDPYFFTKVQQRLEEKHRSKITVQTVLKPAFFTLLILVNLGTAIWQYNKFQTEVENERQEKLLELFMNKPQYQSNEANLLRLN